MKLSRFCLCAAGILLYTSGPALAAKPDLQQGQAVYDKWCAPCHAPGNAYPGTMALQTKYEGKIPAVLLERTDMTPEFVKTFVRTGVSIMPFFRKTEISDAELESLAEYLVTKNK
jgi:mono/diheme cytochrome c family protein